jgi:hypothetical protein
VHHASPREGSGWHDCARVHRNHEDACPGHWLNIVLAPGTTGTLLAARYGISAARALLAALEDPRVRAAVTEGTWRPVVLVPRAAAEPAHLQLVLSRRSEHLWRHAPLPRVLRAVGLLSDAQQAPAA